MAAVDLSKLVKEKRFWAASFLIAWAAALQGHMMWLKRQDAFQGQVRRPRGPQQGHRAAARRHHHQTRRRAGGVHRRRRDQIGSY
uniref:Predicted protein n=1 Tax=Hordeum vulgare subsp. vulgare TaxID=112509 RepID=F2D5Y7_HORVV|nr:predicted protein [Hordeum vulgare subsp. vulgare]